MTKPKTKPKAANRSAARKSAKPVRKRSEPASFRSAAGPDTKHARIIAMLRVPTGATIAAIMTVTDWQQHSVRGFLAGVIRKKLGLNLVSEQTDTGRVYRIQADHLGDLDHKTRQVLDRTFSNGTGAAMSARLASLDQKRNELSPGTVLVREWDRQSQRVMVMADGFAWNGQTYDSLSKVAFAITGTKWNGPRFFGLREKEDRSAMKARP